MTLGSGTVTLFLSLFPFRNVPVRIRIRCHRKRNEDEDSPHKFYTLVTHVPVDTFKGWYSSVVPYSGKLPREKTFANWWKIRVSWRKLSRIARLCCTKDDMPSNFAEKTFANSHKNVKFAKVFSLESFLLYGIYEQETHWGHSEEIIFFCHSSFSFYILLHWNKYITSIPGSHRPTLSNETS